MSTHKSKISMEKNFITTSRLLFVGRTHGNILTVRANPDLKKKFERIHT